MKKSFFLFSIVALAIAGGLHGCQQSANGTNNASKEPSGLNTKAVAPYTTDAAWNKYWFDGKAELTSYTLMQNRYGEIHEGTVVNIFVTEDFSKEKQVKLDNSSAAGTDKLPILKFNQSFKFVTGVYPYSLMLSSFQPLDINNYPHAVKITSSVQEWCGMASFQMNLVKGRFNIESRSYFESEGDKDFDLEMVVQEDELWNQIRINPNTLPKGAIKILPGSLYLRLSHKPLEAVNATADLRDENGIMVYIIDMPSLNRKLSFRFEKSFPYKIWGWEDAYPGFDGKILTTTAIRKTDMMLDYWRTHNNEHRILREQLGLPKDTQ